MLQGCKLCAMVSWQFACGGGGRGARFGAPRGGGRREREDVAPGRLLLVLEAVLLVHQCQDVRLGRRGAHPT